MKKSLNRLVCTLVAVMMLFSLAACGGGSENPEKATADMTEATTQVAEEKPTIRLSVLVGAGSIKSTEETDVGKAIKDKFGIVLDYIGYTGNEAERQNLALAGGDYPDLISLRGEELFQKYLQAGVPVQLDNYLDKMPNFKKLYSEQIPYWRLSDKDGRLFKWEGMVPLDPKVVLSTYNIFIRSDVLEKQGYPKVLSASSYIDLIRQGMKDFPTTDDQATIGMAAPFAESYGMLGIAPIMYEKGDTYPIAIGRTVIYNQKKDVYEALLENEDVKDSLLFFNKLYREGLLDKESFTDKAQQVTDKANAHRPLAVWYANWCVTQANDTSVQKGDTSQYYIHLPIQSDAQIARGDKMVLLSGIARNYESCIMTNKVKEENRERVFEFLDWTCTDAGQRLLATGIEGKHYTVENGVVKLTQEYIDNMNNMEYMQKAGIGKANRISAFATPVIADANGIPYRIEEITDDRVLAIKKKETEIYGKYGFKDLREWMSSIGNVFYTGLNSTVSVAADSDLGKLNAMVQDYMGKNLPKTIMNPQNDAEFNKVWDEFIAGYKKMEPQKLVDELNRQYTEKKMKLEEMKKK